MSSFDDFFNELKNAIVDISTQQFNEYKDDLINCGEEFLNDTKDDFVKWRDQLLNGSLPPEEFEWLLKSKQSVLEMKIRTQIGLAKATVDKITNGIIDAIISKTLTKLL